MVFSKSVSEGVQADKTAIATRTLKECILCVNNDSARASHLSLHYFADDTKLPYTTCWENVNARRWIFLHLDTVLKNSTPGKWANVI